MSLRSIVTSEFDYNILMDALRDYRYPRNKIRSLLSSGAIIRVKKGLYIKGEEHYSLAVLANMIYGPSYVSQHYALSLYGLIPEKVHMVTSMTLGRHKRFDTPVGVFNYDPLPERLYSLGVKRVEQSPTQPYLLASPEKALLDMIWKRKDLDTPDAIESFLLYDLRLDLDQRKPFSLSHMRILERAYKKRQATALAKFLSARFNNE